MQSIDQVLSCNNCGSPFTWSTGEQRFYASKGFMPPKTCPACRQERRSRTTSGSAASPGEAPAAPRQQPAPRRAWHIEGRPRFRDAVDRVLDELQRNAPHRYQEALAYLGRAVYDPDAVNRRYQNAWAVSDGTFAIDGTNYEHFILVFLHEVGHNVAGMARGDWSEEAAYAYAVEVLRELGPRDWQGQTNQPLVTCDTAQQPHQPHMVTLGRDRTTGQPVTIDADARTRGLYIIGRTGTGKTTLIASLAQQDIAAGQGVCVLDPVGGLITRILAQLPREHEGRVILLDIDDDQSVFGLNLYECANPTSDLLVSRAREQVVAVFAKLWGEEGVRGDAWGPQLEEIISNSATTLIEAGYTLAELPLLLLDDRFRQHCVQAMRNDPVRREFWQLAFNQWSKADRDFRINSTRNKVGAFTNNPLSRAIFGQQRSTIDFRTIMDEGKVLLVRLSPNMERLSNLVGTVLISKLMQAAFARPEGQRRPFYVYADEFQRFATPDFTRILPEGRQFRMSFTVAHQTRSQLDDKKKGATRQVGTLVVFPVDSASAAEVAGEFNASPPNQRVIGQRPKRAVSPNPVAELVRGGHANPAVRRFAHDYLSRMHEALQSPADCRERMFPDDLAPPTVPGGFSRYLSDHGTLRAALRDINRYLSDVMERRLTLYTPPERSRFLVIMLTLRAFIGFGQEVEGPPLWLPFLIHPSDEVRQALQHYLAARDISRPQAGTPALQRARAALIAALERCPRQHVEPGSYPHPTRLEPTFEDNQKRTARVQGELRRIDDFLAVARDVGQLLAVEPIEVNTGQYEPEYERRTVQDLRNDIANALVNPENVHHARCKVWQRVDGQDRRVEYQLADPGFQPATLNPDTLARIRAQTRRQGYCRERAEVEAEIAERQRPFLGTDPGGAAPLRKRQPL
jgi:energy-coupling factor transporter ATP-binding protein EcfA2